MLDILRANKNSVLTWIILVAIAVVFAVSFGPGTRGFTDSAVRAAGYAARVNGQAIPAAEFERRYTQLYRIYQQRAGQAFTRELADQLGLRSMAMNGVVERELVLEEAQRHGLHVSDAELSDFVNEMPEFQRPQGGFDETLYKRSTSASYGSPAKFEQRLREDLLYQRMLALLRDTAWVSEDEVYRAWLAEADRADAVVVRFPFAAARAEVKVSDAEVQAFLAANGARIEQVYKEDTARYHKPKRVRARHVLVKVAESAPAAEQEAARKKIEAIAERARRGEDFAKLAAETSDEPGAKDKPAASGDHAH